MKGPASPMLAGRDDLDEPIRRAAAVLAAGGALPTGPTPPSRSPSRADRTFMSIGILTVVLLIAVGLSFGRGSVGACPTIPFTLEGDVPRYAVEELNLAFAEVQTRTGLTFAPAGDSPSRLVVRWRHGGIPRIAADRLGRPDSFATLGASVGRWVQDGRWRELAGATIDVDASHPWPLGLNRGDSLASVFVHELGHVVGVGHSDDPTSFMHSTTNKAEPKWTAAELDLLAKLGRQAGCPSGAGPA